MSSPGASADSDEGQPMRLLPALLRSARPGSRLLLWQPPDWRTPLELARRGYRLMPLSSSPELLGELRRQLRACGLASQMMGSAALPVHPDPPVPSLASRFYEVAVLWGPRAETGRVLEGLAPALETRAPILREARSSPRLAEGEARFRLVTLSGF